MENKPPDFMDLCFWISDHCNHYVISIGFSLEDVKYRLYVESDFTFIISVICRSLTYRDAGIIILLVISPIKVTVTETEE